MLSVDNGKRITFKRTRPNPIFHDWLEELYEEAKQKGSKLEPMLQEALSSISKYPLPLQSGAECAILKGFDKRLCLFIDKRLHVYKSINNESSVDTYSKSTTTSVSDDGNNVKNAQLSSDHIKNTCITPNTSTECNINRRSTCSPPKNGKKRFKPAFRSGSYALLMVLVELNKNQTMSKGQLTDAAQKYCDEDISKEWKSMTGLIRRGLVSKHVRRNVPQFCLTDEGILVAKELYNNVRNNERFDDVVIINDNLGNNGLLNHEKHTNHDVNDLLYDDNKMSSEIIVINNAKAKLVNNYLQHEGYDKSEVIDLLFDKNKCANEEIVENDIKAKYSCAEKASAKNETGILVDDKCDNLEIIEKHEDYNNYVEMAPGSFDIILIIDTHETSGLRKKNDPTVAQFNKYPELKHEYRSLKVGDFTWIAQHKTNRDQEFVLPYVIERKRMDDLGHSIKDGRFHEQKFRLRKCGLDNVVYLVENHGSNKHVGLPMQSLMQALANTRVQDGFKVHVTESLVHSVRFLATMTLRLIYEYKDKKLKGHNGEPKGDILMIFEHFNKSSVKNKALSVTDTFIKLLLQVKGVSVEKALTITNVYKTPRMLIEKYKSCDQREGEMLLANLKFGELNRSVGPSVSKSIHQLFTFRDLK